MTRKAASTKENPHRGMPNGIPKWVAATPEALMALLPSINRESRRTLIAKSSLTQGKKESDHSVLFRLYSQAGARFHSFWRCADVVGTAYKTSAPPSLEMALFEKIQVPAEETFSAAEFSSSFAEADRILENIKKIRPQAKMQRALPAAGLNHLAKWKWALELLTDYSRLTEEERHTVRTIVFCTASVVHSAWPIEHAIELAPDIAKEFEDILRATDTEVAPPTQTDATAEPKAEASAGPLQRVAEFGKEIAEFIDTRGCTMRLLSESG